MKKQGRKDLAWIGLSNGMAIVITFWLLFTMVGSVQAQEEVMFIHPIADSFADNAFKNTNFGHYTSLRVYHIDVPPSMYSSYAYLKYSIPENLVAGRKYSVVSARLSLTIDNIDAHEVSAVEILVYETSSDWEESTINGNNRPALGDQVGTFYIDENFELYQKVNMPLEDFTFTAKDLSFALVVNPDNVSSALFSVQFLSKEAGSFGTIEFVYTRIYVVPPALISIALLVTLAFSGFGVYRKLHDIHDLDSLIGGFEFLLYLSILIIVAVVLAWTFIK